MSTVFTSKNYEDINTGHEAQLIFVLPGGVTPTVKWPRMAAKVGGSKISVMTMGRRGPNHKIQAVTTRGVINKGTDEEYMYPVVVECPLYDREVKAEFKEFLYGNTGQTYRITFKIEPTMKWDSEGNAMPIVFQKGRDRGKMACKAVAFKVDRLQQSNIVPRPVALKPVVKKQVSAVVSEFPSID